MSMPIDLYSTGAKGDPDAKIAAPFVHSSACRTIAPRDLDRRYALPLRKGRRTALSES